MNLTPEAITERLTKLKETRGATIQAANAQLTPIEAQMRDLIEQKAVIVGNANLAIGKIDGEIKLLEELSAPTPGEGTGEPTQGPVKPALAAVPPIDETTPPPAEV